ncbi:MAG: YjfB family protein [Sterolibacterium sp.]|nr:YjfB family protein [Sterolibacterium sp.]
MDITNMASLASNVSQTEQTSQAQVAVLKKAMQIEAQSAAQLVQAAVQSAPSNPPNLGKHVDTFV